MSMTQAEWNKVVGDAYADWYAKGVGESAMFRSMTSASENADMTAQEQGFEVHSDRWYIVALNGYEELLASDSM